MAEINDNSNSFNDSRTFKGYKRHKQYVSELQSKNMDEKDEIYVDKQYFNCLHCSKVNLIEEIKNEEAENRTFRAKWTTWQKLKQLAAERGGSIENAINYLFMLYERYEDSLEDNYEINIAGRNPQRISKEKEK